MTPELFSRYAHLVVSLAVPLQPGQKLLIISPPETHPLAHVIAEAAFECGAQDVTLLYEDAAFDTIRTANVNPELLDRADPHMTQLLTRHALEAQPILTLHAPFVSTRSRGSPERSARALRARNEALERYGKLRSRVAFSWSVMAAATSPWAAFLRPDLTSVQAQMWLWERLERLLRLDAPDPVAAWRQHAERLMARCARLNALGIATLHLSAPGTDLELGLPPEHRWFGPLVPNTQGVSGIPNMPTEEISTLPHRLLVEGKVRATRPLVLNGQHVEGLELTFRQGRVESFQCAEGSSFIASLLETDEGARRLGEVALVPESSLVAQEKRTFYSTLIDENASCHLALGRAYPVVLEGGSAMSEEAFKALGGNTSRVHLDFMVGSSELSVEALTAGGERILIMHRGEWVLQDNQHFH